MNTDDDSRRAAEKFIERFGVDAARQAEIRAAELRAAGDPEGFHDWLSMRDEIVFLLKARAGPCN